MSYIVDTFWKEEEKEQTEVKKERRKKRNIRYFDRQRGEGRGSQQVHEKDRG